MNFDNNYNGMEDQQRNQQSQFNLESSQNPIQLKSKKNRKKLIVLLILIIGLVLGIFVFVNNKENNNETLENNKIGKVEEGTNTNYDENGAFLMAIGDIFSISGQGTVVNGKIERGTVKIGDKVQIIGLDKEIITAEVAGIEKFKEVLEEAKIGENVAILLKNITSDQVEKGQVIAKPNSIVASTKFEADIYVLSKEEGGKQTSIFSNYRPRFIFRTVDISGNIELSDGIDSINPGENSSVTVELFTSVALEVGTEFSFKENGRVVGTGVVTKLY